VFYRLFLTVLFGLLAYNNIQKLSHQCQLDKKLTVMIFVSNFFVVMPYIIMNLLVLTYLNTEFLVFHDFYISRFLKCIPV